MLSCYARPKALFRSMIRKINGIILYMKNSNCLQKNEGVRLWITKHPLDKSSLVKRCHLSFQCIFKFSILHAIHVLNKTRSNLRCYGLYSVVIIHVDIMTSVSKPSSTVHNSNPFKTSCCFVIKYAIQDRDTPSKINIFLVNRSSFIRDST